MLALLSLLPLLPLLTLLSVLTLLSILLIVLSHLLHLLLQFLGFAAQHLLLPTLLGGLTIVGALLLREFFLAARQLIELLKRFVDVLIALAGRTGGLRRLVLILFGVKFEIK